MHKGFQHVYERSFVLPQNPHRDLAHIPEDAFYAGDAKSIDDILCKTERYLLYYVEPDQTLNATG